MSKRIELTEKQFNFYLDGCVEILGQNEGGWTFRTYSGNICSQEHDGTDYRYFLILL